MAVQPPALLLIMTYKALLAKEIALLKPKKLKAKGIQKPSSFVKKSSNFLHRAIARGEITNLAIMLINWIVRWVNVDAAPTL